MVVSPRSYIGLVLFIGCIALAAGCRSSADTRTSAAAPPPPTVQVATVEQRDVTLTSEWIATMDGYVNARIQPHVSGYLIRQNYREGSFVHSGDVLFEIDPRPCQAALDQSRAQLAQAKSQQMQTQAQRRASSGATCQGRARCHARYAAGGSQSDRTEQT